MSDTKQVNAIKHAESKNHVVVTVQFEREVTGVELDVLRDNFKRGVIKHDPNTNLHDAVVNQLAQELQGACDVVGMAGHFFVEKIVPNIRFADEMWGGKESTIESTVKTVEDAKAEARLKHSQLANMEVEIRYAYGYDFQDNLQEVNLREPLKVRIKPDNMDLHLSTAGDFVDPTYQVEVVGPIKDGTRIDRLGRLHIDGESVGYGTESGKYQPGGIVE